MSYFYTGMMIKNDSREEWKCRVSVHAHISHRIPLKTFYHYYYRFKWLSFKKSWDGDFPGDPVVKILPSNAEDMY